MKQKRLGMFRWAGSLLLASLALCLAACDSKDDTKDEAARIDLSVESLQFSDAGDSKSFNIDANCEWTITIDQSWCRIAAGNKTGSGKKNNIAVMCSANDSDDSREAVLTVKCPSDPKATKDIAIVQLGRASTVTVSKSELSFDAAPSSQTIIVASNADWTIDKPAADTWYTVAPVSGKADDVSTQVNIAVEQNETTEARSSSFDIKYTDNQTKEEKKVTVTVSQKAVVPTVELSKEKVEFLYADEASEQVTLKVQGAWKAAVSNGADWLTVDPAEGNSGEVSVTITVAANAGQATREADVVFTSMEKASATLKVSQSGLAPKVVFTEETISLAASNVSQDVTFSANYAWTASTDDEWLSITPVSGQAGEACVISVTATKNTGAERIGKVNVVCGTDDNKVTSTLNVIQDEYDGEDLSEKGTSNCYIINKAGTTFKFNATVMGNGKADAERNIVVEKLNPAGCQELWRDNAKPIVTDVKYRNGYISFKTPDPLVPGNVVIAANDEYGVIIWSWHLWVDNYDAEKTTYPITYPDGFTPPIPVEFMNRNIGALSDGTSGVEADVIKAFGMMYQWGRKDPFPSSDISYAPAESDGTTKPMYDEKGEQIITSGNYGTAGVNNVRLDLGPLDEFGMRNDLQASIRYSIENPMMFMINWEGLPEDMSDEDKKIYDGSFGGRWAFVPEKDLRNGIYATYLWGNAYGYAGGEYGTKTVYDPCPLGWRVPDRYAWRFVVKSGASGNAKDNVLNSPDRYIYDENNPDNCKYEDFRKGFYLCTTGEGGEPLMFLPAAGARSYSEARFSNWSNTGVLASYWTNGPYAEGISGHKYSVRLQIEAGLGNEDPLENPTYDKVSGSIYTLSSMWPTAGMPVRCVREAAE